MVTKQQLIKNPRRPKRRSTNVPALKGSPFKKGVKGIFSVFVLKFNVFYFFLHV